MLTDAYNYALSVDNVIDQAALNLGTADLNPEEGDFSGGCAPNAQVQFISTADASDSGMQPAHVSRDHACKSMTMA